MGDRLAALRAQRGPAEPTPQNGAYELNSVNTGVQDDFYSEISDIQGMIEEFSGNVSRVSEMHNSSLNAVGDSGQQNLQLLDDQVIKTRDLGNQIKKRIEALKRQPSPPGQQKARGDQVKVVGNKFVSALQRYTQVEKEYRQKQRQRVERQLKIVRPDASPEEIAAAADDPQGGSQVFAGALQNSTSYGESRAAYREVQDRHQDILKIERTITELAQLMNDMAVLIDEQDEVVNNIEETTKKVEYDTEQGLGQTNKAVDYARSARGKRVICFWLTVLLIIIIVAAVAGAICGQGKCSKK